MNSSEIYYAIRSTVYLLTPRETYVEHLKDAPTILPMIVPLTLVLSLVEGIIINLAGQGENWSLHNVIINILTGALVTSWQVFFFRGVELSLYIWCYNNIRVLSLPWNSFYTYAAATIGVDLCAYWWHRASHEISFLWAAHASHHNGDELNLSVSNRVSGIVRFTKWMYFVPVGVLGIPPSVYIVHAQLNFAVALWSHCVLCPKMSKTLPGLGHIMEFLLMTPSNHRVHHGVNKYCLDKNYGMFLVIWDRIFGTFAEEREDEPITYGTVTQCNTFHVVYIQLEPFWVIFNKLKMMKTTGDKVRSLVFGPAWLPGKPRLGDEDDIPDERGRKKKDLFLPLWLNIYLTIHGALIAYTCKDMGVRVELFSQWQALVNFSIILSACYALGGLYDFKLHSLWLEPLRLLFLAAVCQLYHVYSNPAVADWVSVLCLVSLLFWPALKGYLLPSSSKSASVHNGISNKKQN